MSSKKTKNTFFIVIVIFFTVSSLYSLSNKNDYFSIGSAFIFNTAPSKAILFNSDKNNKLYPEFEITFNKSLFSYNDVLFKSEFFYRGYISDNDGKVEGSYNFDFNRDFKIEKLFFDFKNLGKDSIYTFDIGRKNIEQFSPLYRNDGLTFQLQSYSTGTNFSFLIGKNQNYNYNLRKISFDSLNVLVGLSNIQTRSMSNEKNFYLDYEINYTRTANLETKSYISSAVSGYKPNLYQLRSSIEYNISSFEENNNMAGPTFFNIGLSMLSKKLPQIGANYSYINYLANDFGDTTYISENNFHNIRLSYKNQFLKAPKLSAKFYYDMQTGSYESRAITAIIKKDDFFFDNDFSFKAKFGTSENYNLINLGVKTEQLLTNYGNLFLSYGVDIYAYITDTGGNLSFAPNVFIYGKDLFSVENLIYKLYLRETVYPKSFLRKMLFKLELNYEIR